jgi:hypothetical protein
VSFSERVAETEVKPLEVDDDADPDMMMTREDGELEIDQGLAADVYARVCSCRQCWASKCRGL